MKQNVFIVIPAFNEGKVIRSVVEGIKMEGLKHVIVVDDGSSDKTSKEAEKTKATVIRHIMNRGKGAAIKTGIEAAKILGADSIITFDGDGQHDPDDIKTMIRYLQQGYDVVLGSRFLQKRHVPFLKRIANYGANCITYLLFGIWVTDSQSGLRAYGKRAIFAIDTEHDRYEFDTEVLREVRKYGLSHKEMPMHIRYTMYSQKKTNRQTAWSGIMTMVRIVISA